MASNIEKTARKRGGATPTPTSASPKPSPAPTKPAAAVETPDLSVKGFKEWNVFQQSCLDAGVPVKVLGHPYRSAQEHCKSSMDPKLADVRLVLHEEDLAFPSGAYAAIGAAAHLVAAEVTIVTLSAQTSKIEGVVFGVKDGRKARKDKGPRSAKECEDPLGAFSSISLRTPSKYVDPADEASGVAEKVMAIMGLEQEQFNTALEAFDSMVSEVLGRYNASKTSSPFIRTGVAVLCRMLCAARDLGSSTRFQDGKFSYVGFLKNQPCQELAYDICTKKATGTKQKRAKEIMQRFADLLAGTIVEVVPEGVDSKDKDHYVYYTLDSKDKRAIGVNMVMHLCHACDRTKNEGGTGTFMSIQYDRAATAKSRPYLDLIITIRVQNLAELEAIPGYAVSAGTWTGLYVSRDKESDENPLQDVLVQPALAGFRSYIGNLHGRAKYAGRVTAAMGSTVLTEAGQKSRAAVLLAAMGKVQFNFLDEWLALLSSATETSWNRVMASIPRSS